MAILKRRKAKTEDIATDTPRETVVPAPAPLPGFPARIVHGFNHQLLLLVDRDVSAWDGTLLHDFSAKSACEAWIVDFTDPDLLARVEAWRNK